ncbi:MAG: site-specific DNA-methyltransferase [Desulfobacterales bacterium]
MKFYETLENQLKNEPNFVTDDGELKKWVVIHKAQNCDAELIELLLDNQELKEKFFVNVKGTLVFNQNLFVQFMEQKNYLNDSYTRYKNKVGLTIDGKYLKQRNEVALVWPFKDCILEGGQSREEDRREEIFFNEILAQDEITQLLEPKVLTNAKRIDKDGEKPINQFNRNENGTITDNLIIKGNNLLALHTLKEEFAGKVKLIYIDPPYNTGNDGFGYNDKFNHSAWLTFMKNRLSTAKSLLKEEGFILISCNDDEQAYLKVLCDEVFTKECFIANFIWKARISVDSRALTKVSNDHEYVICYGKKPNNSFKGVSIDASKYKNPDNDPLGDWMSSPLDGVATKERRPNLHYTITNPETGVSYEPNPDNGWRYSKDRLAEMIKQNRIIWPKNPESKPRYRKYINELGSLLTSFSTILDTDHTAYGTRELRALMGKETLKFPKPVNFIKDFLAQTTSDTDIILDFFAGSGTTAHAVLELNKEDGENRQFITCEQMNYIETVTAKRVQKVIEQNKSSSFVYLELKKYNQTFIEQIEEAKDTETLLQIWEQMKAKSFLNYNVDIKKQEEHIEDFKALSLKEQKQHLCEILDKNQLYVNLSSLNDKDFACTDEEKQVTRDFYR